MSQASRSPGTLPGREDMAKVNPSSDALISVAEAIVNIQVERAKAHCRLVTISAEARQLHATLIKCDLCQEKAQAELEVLAEQ